MFMHELIKIGLVCLVLVLSNGVLADWYVGAEVIENQAIPFPYSLIDQSSSNIDLDDDNSVSLFGGFRTNKFFSLQVEYQDDLAFGIDDMFAGSSLWFPETESASFESNALYLSGISSYSINDSASLYMKGGVFNWEIDSKLFNTNGDLLQQSSGTDVFYGLGANYDLNPRFEISAEWERYQMEESDVDYLSTELKFRF